MNISEALAEAAAAHAVPEELEAFEALLDEYEQLVGVEEYENTTLMAYRMFLGGRLYQEALEDEDAVPINVQLSKIQAANLIALLLGPGQ